MEETIFGLFFDSETTGLPLWKEPSEIPEQPHIVSLYAELVNMQTREVVDSMDVIVKPEGWTIPEETIAVHGITNEHAAEVGISEKDALSRLLELRARSSLRIAHNKTFDDRIVRIGLKRFFDDLSAPEETPQPSDDWKEGESFCTCYGTKAFCNLPGKKLPKLEEAYKILLGKDMEGAHNARNDTVACKEVYFAFQDATQPKAA